MITGNTNQAIAISDRSAIGEARRLSALAAERARLNPAERDRVPLIVSELATNLFLYARDGEILLRIIPGGVEVLAIDRGPGMDNVGQCLTDGYSSRGSLGSGLGAVKRLSTHFDIHSSQPSGTVVLSCILNAGGQSSLMARFSAICVTAPGQTACGDGWAVERDSGVMTAVVVDGLGHGPAAAMATSEALRVFAESARRSPAAYIEAANQALHSTRGAALAIAQVGLAPPGLSYLGIGNITGRLVTQSGKSRTLPSHNGIVGTAVRRLSAFGCGWQEDDLLIMHSDGLRERWNISDYPALARADPGMIAGLLYRDGKRGRDDATVFVSRLATRAIQGV